MKEVIITRTGNKMQKWLNHGEEENKGILKRFPIIFLSLITTPLIIFISTANTLYLGNQGELNHQVQVLLPFIGLFFISILVGFLLFLVSKRRLWGIALWAYYLVGPYFLVFSFLRGTMTSIMDSAYVLAGFMFLFVLNVGFVQKKISLKGAAKIFSVFSIVFIISEAVTFAVKFESIPSALINLSESRQSTIVEKKLPNVYHIVLDEYQTDMFDLTKTSEVEEELAGFTYFPETTTIFGRTTMSLASVFLGKSYDYQSPQSDYWYAAYNTSKSFLHRLVEEGYETYAFIHKSSHMFEQKYFHHRIPHAEFAECRISVDQQRLFENLWFYKHLPIFISSRLIPNEDLSDLKGQKLLAKSAPLLSYDSFRKYLEVEKKFSPFNRYTFLHLIFPHFPNIFNEDCTCAEKENGDLGKTSPLEQAACANKMILDLVTHLKHLNRFKDSLIIVHGDHGSRYRRIGDDLSGTQKFGFYSLEFSWGRSRSLLLVKPPGVGDDVRFSVSTAEVTLLDIAPTVLRSLELPMDEHLEGVSLFDPELPFSRGKRYYHWFAKEGKGELTHQLTRYVIDKGKIYKDKEIDLVFNSSDRQLRNRIEKTGKRLFIIKGQAASETLGFNKQIRIMDSLPGKGDILALQATGNDPTIILPALNYPGNALTVLKIDITCPEDSEFFQVFYMTIEKKKYNEKQSVKCGIRKGRNVIYLEIPNVKLTGRLRLDPGRVAGEYLIHELEVRSVTM